LPISPAGSSTSIISTSAGLIGKAVEELAVPGEIAVSAILRGGRGVLPVPGTAFQKDDILYVNVLRESADKLERLLGLKE
jgi:Trk K+ transport system NAD-binding subunit